MVFRLPLLTLLLAAAVLALQVPLWVGKGSWLRVLEVDRLLLAQRDVNERLSRRNATLDAEIRDLKQGSDAIEERARAELGLIKADEVFIQVVGSERESAPAQSRGSPTRAALAR